MIERLSRGEAIQVLPRRGVGRNVPNRRSRLQIAMLLAVEGRVDRLTDVGAFVEVEPGIEGLIHIPTCRGSAARKIRPRW